MSSSRKIKSALVSVFNKDGLEPILKKLHSLGIELISTGGTQSFIEGLGLTATPVERLTDYPSIFGGRVKTLHPKIFGGILYRRENEQDLLEQKQYEIPSIDLVIVDLYPFEETVRTTKDTDAIIEKIDIGGISLIRAAAKNYADTIIVSSRNDYAALLDLLNTKLGVSDIEDRKYFATRAFATSSNYDGLIHSFFANGHIEGAGDYKLLQPAKVLRYGENPHQQAKFYGNLEDIFDILNGKELSYNNLVDIDASIQLIQEFFEPTVAIIKHTNSCGLASAENICEAYKRAFACDTTSAFGGIITANKTIDLATANEMNSLFFEVLIAPDFEPSALEILKQKKNRIIIRQKKPVPYFNMFKSLLNGAIEQDIDRSAEGSGNFKVVTDKQPTQQELSDLEFAIKAVKHLKSNGIALVKNRQLIGMGCGQTSRVDALQQAIKKAGEFGFDLKGSVMASDAFFPFPDCVGIAATAGIAAISQPGGSIKDQDSIDAANANKQAMVLTGIRHFKH
jgi:phosphoribosylaminoimidazolecarboxamide formyltransferase / IMP cyclohydrolase